MFNRGQTVSFKPSAYYWRADIRAAADSGDVTALRELAEALVDELADHKAFIRRRGLIPPKNRMGPSEHAAKVQRVLRFESASPSPSPSDLGSFKSR